MSSDDFYRQELGYLKERTEAYLAKNEDYLLNNGTGLKLTRGLLDRFVAGWVEMARRSADYDINFYAMRWFIEMMMGPMVNAVVVATMVGVYDYPPSALRELFEGIELAYALDTKADTRKLTLGRKLRILERCAKSDSVERRTLIEYASDTVDLGTRKMMTKFYGELSDFTHAPGYVARGFKSGRLSDHFPPTFEDMARKRSMKDYVPERWLVPMFDLSRLQEDEGMVDQMIRLFETFSSLAKLIFDKWESMVAKVPKRSGPVT